jgi:TolA-binding protein
VTLSKSFLIFLDFSSQFAYILGERISASKRGLMMRQISKNWMIFGLLGLLLGCSNPKVRVSEEDLAQSKAQNAQLGTQISELRVQLAASDSVNQVLEQTLKNRDTMIDQQEMLIKDLDMQVQKYKSQEPKSQSATSVNSPTNPETVAKSPVEPKTTSSDFQTEYNRARILYDKKSFKPAEVIYRSLIEKEPQNKLASNCQYWIGECFYGLKQYDTALAEFQKVFTHPSAPKADAAQLKIAYCYKQLKKYNEAREELNRLLSSYPSSEFVPRARALLDELP